MSHCAHSVYSNKQAFSRTLPEEHGARYSRLLSANPPYSLLFSLVLPLLFLFFQYVLPCISLFYLLPLLSHLFFCRFLSFISPLPFLSPATLLSPLYSISLLPLALSSFPPCALSCPTPQSSRCSPLFRDRETTRPHPPWPPAPPEIPSVYNSPVFMTLRKAKGLHGEGK